VDVHSAAEGELSFSSKENATQFLRQHLAVFSPEAVTELITSVGSDTDLIQRVSVRSTTPPGASPVLVARYRWVIKDEDLGLADAFLEALRNASSVGFFVVASATDTGKWAAAAVGTFTALFKLCRNVLNKGGILNPSAYEVLVTLKTLGPLSIEELLTKLREHNGEWIGEALAKSLESLKAAPMRNGSVRALVMQDHQGRWSTADV
jgi:hypothetical protein